MFQTGSVVVTVTLVVVNAVVVVFKSRVSKAAAVPQRGIVPMPLGLT
jgi:hypothetical protein